jgi:hypothetical protein
MAVSGNLVHDRNLETTLEARDKALMSDAKMGYNAKQVHRENLEERQTLHG